MIVDAIIGRRRHAMRDSDMGSGARPWSRGWIRETPTLGSAMDNVCHTLVGAACGEAGLKQRTRFGNAALMIAANLPDLDVLVFATDVPSVAFRRGWTHGTLAQMLLPVLLTATIAAIDRFTPGRAGAQRVRVGWLLLCSYIGVLSHVMLDWLNSYGVRLLMPFDGMWFYGDTLFIIDPWLWLALGLGVWRARRRGDSRPARRAIVIASVYIAVMCLAAQLARGIVADAWRAAHGSEPSGLMVGPAPVTPFRRDVIVDAGAHYVTGTFTWFPAHVTFDPSVTPKNDRDPRVAQARGAPPVRGFLIWSRFPFWTFQRTTEGTEVTLSDMRFRGRGRPFVQTVTLP
jgi:inner membrane protein